MTMININNFDEVNNASGMTNGELFTSEQEVLDYFKVENFQAMFGECEYTQDDLNEMARSVVKHGWNF